jgi:peptidyl-prolyl cis-trans isomerase D
MWALALLIIPAFVIWGAGTSAKNKSNKPDYAGKLFGKKVSYEDYYNMWNVARDYAIKSFGNNAPAELINQLAWSRIILIEEAKRQNLRVTDQEVVEKITSFQAFQRKGSFDKRLYKSMLLDTARSFEEKLRDDLLISKLKNKITSGIKVNDEDIKKEYKKSYEKIKFLYVLIPFSDSEKDAQYNDSDLENFYEQNKQAFRKSEQANIKYIEILYSRFDNEIDIKDEQVKRFFEEHIMDFKKSGSDENPVLEDTIKSSIREKLGLQRKISLAEEFGYKLLDGVIQKKNLEEPARVNSLEIKETGFFSANEGIPNIGWSYDFTKASFELQKNEIHNTLLKTDNGLYIIQLKEKKEPYLPDYAEIKDIVKNAFIKEESIKLSQKQAENICLDITNNIKTNETLENVVTKYGLQLKQTDFISWNDYIPEIGPAKEFIDIASSVKIGSISKPLKTPQGWVILEPLELRPIDEVKFIEEKDKFRENLLENKKEEEFNKYFQDLQKRAGFISYVEKR